MAETIELLKEVATVKAVQREVEQVEPQNEITLGELMRNFRARNGLTLEELAKLVGTSGSSYLSQLETGKKVPSARLVRKLSEVMKYPFLDLLQISQTLTPKTLRCLEPSDFSKEAQTFPYERLAEAEKALQEIAKFFGLTYDELLERFK